MRNQLQNLVKGVVAISVVASMAMMTSCCSSNKDSKCEQKASNIIELPVPEREAGVTDMMGYAAPAIPVVRVGVIGLGMRGPGAVERLSNIEGVEIVALCDIRPEKVTCAQEILKKYNKPAAAEYSGAEDSWKALCDREDIDLVYITTDWKHHTPMAVYAMEKGKHAVSEVPSAVTIDECWQLVNTSEKTRKHFMMLENCCYDFFEMATLNMAQQGLLGDLVHAEGAYIHDLRSLCFDKNGYYDMWRLNFNTEHDGNPYPTHGLGPIAQALNINYGDKMDYLVSMSCDQKGLTAYAKEKLGTDSPEATKEYKKGDMNTTLVKTANGKTMMIQHDVTSPRPYNRKHALSGTKGYIEKYPREGIAIEPNAHSFMSEEDMKKTLAQYEHPITKEIGEVARKVGGHGGMDFIMDYRLIYCLQNGLPLDMSVYDAATWSSLVELTEISTQNNGAPVAVPDFTRGAWNKINGFKHAMKN